MSSARIIAKPRRSGTVVVTLEQLKINGDLTNNGITTSCISCLSFDERAELCKSKNLHGKHARPPARVIAFGCDWYDDNEDIPF